MMQQPYHPEESDVSDVSDVSKEQPYTSVFPPVQANRSNEPGLDTLLHQYLAQIQGGRLYPERIPVHTMERVLDIGCGSGEWIFDLARRHPNLHIYGIDTCHEALRQATVRRNMSNLRQVEFRYMDLTQPFPAPTACCDFIHMRFCARFVQPHLWPQIISECQRVLRPQGWLTLVELELCGISSSATMALQGAMTMARAKSGYSMDGNGFTTGVASRLYSMLLEANLQEVAYEFHIVDLGFMGGTPARLFLSEMVRHSSLAKPFVVQQGILSGKEFDDLIAHATFELQAPDLCGWAILISACGKRGELYGRNGKSWAQ